MINVVSWPPDLTQWKSSKEHPFYFEVFGEAEPKIDMSYAVVQPAGNVGSPNQLVNAAPVYEYWWTIGRAGVGDDAADEFWKHFEDAAARVYLYFPTWHGWRIKELDANLKYLSPVEKHKDLSTSLSKVWSDISPVLSAVSTTAGFATGLPVAGAALGQISSNLGALAKLQVNSVPPTGDFNWSVEKVTFGSKGVWQGVLWTLPKRVLTDLGGRITGSLALSFIPAPAQQNKQVLSQSAWKPEPGKLAAHMKFYKKHEEEIPGAKPGEKSKKREVPETRTDPPNPEFIYLHLDPQVP